MPLLRTSLLSAEPAGVLESLDELFALAHAMEQEAADNYDSLAKEMRGQGKDDLAEVFTHLAAAEREHVDSVTQWSQSRRGKRPDPAMVRWEAPEAFAPEAAAEVKTSRLMTPYRALAIAVRNEERAFAFWSYLAAYSHDPEVKKASEAMAKEELGHVATLRKERRRAYHQQHERDIAEASTTPQPLIDARRLEFRLAAQLGEIEQRQSGPAAVRTRDSPAGKQDGGRRRRLRQLSGLHGTKGPTGDRRSPRRGLPRCRRARERCSMRRKPAATCRASDLEAGLAAVALGGLNLPMQCRVAQPTPLRPWLPSCDAGGDTKPNVGEIRPAGCALNGSSSPRAQKSMFSRWSMKSEMSQNTARCCASLRNDC